MSIKIPATLRAGGAAIKIARDESNVGKVSAVASLIAVASISGAEAQKADLPPVTVDAPIQRPHPQSPNPRQSKSALATL